MDSEGLQTHSDNNNYVVEQHGVLPGCAGERKRRERETEREGLEEEERGDMVNGGRRMVERVSE